jgi:Ca2+-binding EF-hand superfamily protein
MEAFSADVKQRTGLALSFSEAHKLYSLYYNPNSKSVDYTKLYADLLDGTEDSSQQSAPKTASTPVRLTFEEVIDMINDRVQQKLDYSIGGERLKKMTSLLSEGRSTVLTKPQLRSTCKLRLDIVLSDHEVDSIFGRLDPQKSGIIKVKELIRTFKKPVAEQDMSLSIGGNEILPARKEAVRTKGSEAARISFDGQFLNLVPPDPRDCPLYSVWEIENIIRERITESGGSFTGSSTKTAQRMFGSGGHYTGDLRISLDQLRFTFWKTFRLDVSDSDLQRFFQRYETDGAILLSRLIAGIFREASADTARSSPAVVEVAMPSAERVSPAADAVPSAPAPQINSLDAFFATVR